MLALRQTEWQRVNLKTTALETLYGGEIVLSTYLVKRNPPVILSHQCSATVSLETYPPPPPHLSYHSSVWKRWSDAVTIVFPVGYI